MLRFRVQAAEVTGQPASEVSVECEDGRAICVLQSVKDSKRGWCTAFLLMAEELEGVRDLDVLLTSVPDLLSAIPDTQVERVTFARVMRGLYEFLHRSEAIQIRRRHEEQIPRLREFLFSCNACCQPPYYVIQLRLAEEVEPILDLRHPAQEYDWPDIGKECCERMVNKAWREDLMGIEQLLTYCHEFQAVLDPDDSFQHKSFANLLKALVNKLLTEPGDLHRYLRRVPEMCAFIVRNEHDSVEEQKLYLGHILSSSLPGNRERAIVQEVLADVRADAEQARRVSRDPHLDETRRREAREKAEKEDLRLLMLTSLVSEHYLNLYDLKQAIDVWDVSGHRDWILRVLLILHRHPGLVLAALVTLLIVPTVLYHPQLLGEGKWIQDTVYLFVALLPIYVVTLLVAFWVIWRYLRRRPLFYMQLFFPRLLGAIVVGLTLLLLDDLPWKIGVLTKPVNAGLILSVTLILAFAYIFFEVYDVMRYQPRCTVGDAVRASRNLFLIGLVESLVAVVVASTLFFPALEATLKLPNDILKLTFDGGTWLSLAYFPRLVALWGGLSLFFGAFLQLLWQDRRLTSA